jgi:simple sugar transport system substrate-binding protein
MFVHSTSQESLAAKMKTRTSLIKVIITLLFILIFPLEAGCSTPAPAAATQTPAATIPAATEIAAAAPAGGKWCGDVSIVFFPGGLAGGAIANNVYNGARQAETDLGPKVQYVFSDWDPQKILTQFKEAAATKPDGIAVIGIPGEDAFETLIDGAEGQGIIVTSQYTTLNRIEAKYKIKGFGYVGTELYQAGFSLGQEAVKRFDLKKGDRTMVWGLLSQPTRGLRTKGVKEALEKAGLTVDYIEIDAATNADPAAGAPTFAGYISSHPDVKLVVTDHGGMTAFMETYLKAAGKGPDDIKAIGFDLSPATVAAIKGNWTDLVIDQQPWLQGYLPILQICLTKVYGFSGLHIDTGAGFASKENIDFLAPLVAKEIR